MGFVEEREKIVRTPVWLVKLYLDQCGLEYGSSPCTASGSPYCYYTYYTCKDKKHFDQDIEGNYLGTKKVYRFCSRGAFLLKDALPLVEGLSYVPMEIDLKTSTVSRADLTIRLSDDRPLVFSNPEKLYSNLEASGSYWRNLMARNPNYHRRIIEVYQGFYGLEESEFRLYFRGVLENIKYRNYGVELICKDLLKLADVKSHIQQPDWVALASDYSGGSTVPITDASRLPLSGLIYIEGKDKEQGASWYVKYSGIDGNNLQNASYIFGSTGTAYSGSRVLSVLVYGRDNYGLKEGFPIDWVIMDLLCNRASLAPEYIRVVDSGCTLSLGINSTSSWIQLSSPQGAYDDLPPSGVIKIDDEFIIYRERSGSSLYLEGDSRAGTDAPLFYRNNRGAFRTKAVSHSAGARVYIPRITREAHRWITGALFRNRIHTPTKVQDLLNKICIQSLGQLWQNEDGLIDFRIAGPPEDPDSLPAINEVEHIIEGSQNYDDNSEQRCSRTIVYYNPSKPDAGANPEDYLNCYIYIESEPEQAYYYGDIKAKEFYADWIYNEFDATSLAVRHTQHYYRGGARLGFALELKDSSIQLGDCIKINSSLILKEDGVPDASKPIYEVIRKKMVREGRYEYLVQRLGTSEYLATQQLQENEQGVYLRAKYISGNILKVGQTFRSNIDGLLREASFKLKMNAPLGGTENSSGMPCLRAVLKASVNGLPSGDVLAYSNDVQLGGSWSAHQLVKFSFADAKVSSNTDYAIYLEFVQNRLVGGINESNEVEGRWNTVQIYPKRVSVPSGAQHPLQAGTNIIFCKSSTIESAYEVFPMYRNVRMPGHKDFGGPIDLPFSGLPEIRLCGVEFYIYQLKHGVDDGSTIQCVVSTEGQGLISGDWYSKEKWTKIGPSFSYNTYHPIVFTFDPPIPIANQGKNLKRLTLKTNIPDSEPWEAEVAWSGEGCRIAGVGSYPNVYSQVERWNIATDRWEWEDRTIWLCYTLYFVPTDYCYCKYYRGAYQSGGPYSNGNMIHFLGSDHLGAGDWIKTNNGDNDMYFIFKGW